MVSGQKSLGNWEEVVLVQGTLQHFFPVLSTNTLGEGA